MFESLASCSAFRCSAPLNMTGLHALTLHRFNGIAQVLRCLLRLRFVFQRALCLIDDRFERDFVRHGKVGENFSIQPDARGR
jgi:hypothetical protein